jgi:hypothetical protein
MTAAELIYQMLTENTGRHMLDSGGAYGRNWERNQGKTIEDFQNEPEAWLEIEKFEREGEPVRYFYDVTISLFHHLDNNLILDEVCEQFNMQPVDDWDSDKFYGVSSYGQEWLLQHGMEELNTGRDSGFNSYNWSASYTQVIQGHFLVNPFGNKYVLLQIHGGCDIRGGYTDAKLFRLINDFEGEYYLLDEMASFDLGKNNTEDDTKLYLDWMGQDFISYEGHGMDGADLDELGAKVGEGVYTGYLIGR